MEANAANLQGPQITPKDQLSARLQERQRFYDMLTAQLQLRQTQVNLLRQTDQLGVWIGNPGAASTTTPDITPAAAYARRASGTCRRSRNNIAVSFCHTTPLG